MPEHGVRPWVDPRAARMAAELVRPVFDAEAQILGRLVYRDGKERFEPRLRGPKASVALGGGGMTEAAYQAACARLKTAFRPSRGRGDWRWTLYRGEEIVWMERSETEQEASHWAGWWQQLFPGERADVECAPESAGLIPR
jgi:hypothetical protein